MKCWYKCRVGVGMGYSLCLARRLQSAWIWLWLPPTADPPFPLLGLLGVRCYVLKWTSASVGILTWGSVAWWVQVSISGQALVFVVRTLGWSFTARAGLITYVAFILAQFCSTMLALFGFDG
jgi:hypothetical protein